MNLRSPTVWSASMTTGRGPGPLTIGLAPTSVTLGTGGVVAVSGGNAVPNSRIDIAIDGLLVATTASGPDGNYATSFTVEADGTVHGSSDTAVLGEGAHQVLVTSPDCSCSNTATLVVDPEP